MTIDDSVLLKNLIVSVVIDILIILIVIYNTRLIVDRINNWREAKYRFTNNIKQKKRKRHKISLRVLISREILLVVFLIFFMFKTGEYWNDYRIKDYKSVTGVVQSVTYKSNYRSSGSWKVRIQGREDHFDLSKKQVVLVKEGEIHTIIYARRTGMILEVQ